MELVARVRRSLGLAFYELRRKRSWQTCRLCFDVVMLVLVLVASIIYDTSNIIPFSFSENIVGESVVVIKKLLQLAPKDHKDLIVRVAKMVDNLTVPMAKASILWMIGEYCNFIPKIAPDILRKSAKSFPNEVRMC